MNMKKMMLMLVALFAMTVSMAQNANGRQPRKMDAATVTTMMTQQLGLNADQQKKVEALNKKYESILRPGFGGPRPQRDKILSKTRMPVSVRNSLKSRKLR